MSDYTQQKPQYPSGECGDKPHDPPPNQGCPDPCDEQPSWGPPKIREGCCTPNPCCSDHDNRCCTWDDVDDPCVRAASAECTNNWAKIECKCQSGNEKCCEEWSCGGYPEGVCVPCEPCKGLLPEPPDDGGGGCDDNDIDCSSGDLSKQLDNLTKCISFQQGEKAKLEADIKARQDREKELRDLIEKYETIYETYKIERPKLICREDCLKRFYGDTKTFFGKYDKKYLDALTKAINDFLCKLEMAKCCQKNLDQKLTKITKLIAEKEKADKELAKAEKAFAIIKDFPKWIDDRFKDLETLKDQITKALNETDPESHKWAFYLFYWKFVPQFCRCFPFPFCCDEKTTGSEENPEQSQQSQQSQKQQQQYETPQGLGCYPGDWHPSKIEPESLKTLICCAWDYARKKKQAAQEANDNLENAKRNLELIKKNVDDATKNFDKNLKNAIKPVGREDSNQSVRR